MILSKLLATTALSGLMMAVATGAAAQSTQQAPTTGPGTPKSQTTADTGLTSVADDTPAAAVQEQGPAQDGSNDQDREVTVTGSRLRSTGGTIDGAVPVTTVSAAELLGSRGDVSLGDALNQLPQLRSTFSQANSTASIGTAGINLLDLRGLGVNRTLTLINGRRAVTAVPGSYTPDINTIPSDLVQSVDITTGGNSAIYGSDAVAGVVNFNLRKDYEGVRLKAQGGETTYGDRGNYSASLLAGHNFADGKVNVTAAVEFTHANALYYADRDYLGAFTGPPGFVNTEITGSPTRNTDGIPNTGFLSRGNNFGNISLGGYNLGACATAANKSLVCTGRYTPGTGGVLGGPTVAGSVQSSYNFAFQPDGTLARDDEAHGLIDRRRIGGGVIGGLSATGIEDAMLEPGLDRINGTLLMHADFSDAFKPFAEANLTHVVAHQQSVQPSFANGGTLPNSFSINNPFLSAQARSTLVQVLAPNSLTFTSSRFNNDLGTRAEDHKRTTYRAVLGVEGDISHTANLHYEIAANYGRTENYYQAGGNVLIANYNKAVNAVLAPTTYSGSNYVLNGSGQKVVCAVNADASTTNDDAGCYPLNTFGYGAGDPRAVNYVLYPSTRNQWADEVDGTAYITGDSTGLFKLPGGPVGFVIGGEYRRERAYSAYDATTRAGLTFLNSAAIFAPPALEVKEAYGEISLPLLKNLPFIHNLEIQGAGRVSDYGGSVGSVTAWDAGVMWSPFRDLRIKATLDRSVRAPNLTNLYATAATTFSNGLTDPCDQVGSVTTNTSNNIASNPNRVRNCAAAGIPTTLTYVPTGSTTAVTVPWYNQALSGIAGTNQGNPNLVPEVGNDFTVGAQFEPHWVPGLSFGATYYNIRVKNVISGLTGQQIINRCYDDPTSIDNPFCAVVFRRSGTGSSVTDNTFNGQSGRSLQLVQYPFGTAGNGVGFINQPFNFAKLATRGIDIESSYRRQFTPDISATFHLTASYVMDRLSYSYITEPTRYDRIDGTLGDPKWQGSFNIQLKFKQFDLTYNERYVGKQIVSGYAYEQFFSSQGRAPLNAEARPFVFYNPIVYHNLRVGVNPTEKFHLYAGVDNLTNELPPYDIVGNGSIANGDSIYPDTGRFIYVGVEARF